MTAETRWHRHWEVRIDPSTRVGGAVLAWLRKPRYHTRTTVYAASRPKLDRIGRSPYPYGPCRESGHNTASVQCWYLSVLSVLHRWTGFTVRTPDADS